MLITACLCAIMVAHVAAQPSTEVPNQCPEAGNPRPVLYGDVNDCGYYFQCNQGVPIRMPCSPGTVWSDFFETCVGYNSQYDTCTRNNAERECNKQKGAALLIPHPTECQRFYNCSKTAPPSIYSYLKQYEDECPYPEVFDVIDKVCRSFKIAFCGPLRIPAKDPCDYLKNRCGTSHCEPCSSRLPSCVGREDGIYEHPTKLRPFFIVCNRERLVRVQICRSQAETEQGTSPVNQNCDIIWEVSV